jgi:hypothetical protein
MADADDPILDITERGLPVYTNEIDQLIREVWPVCGTSERDELRAMLPDREDLDPAELEDVQVRLEHLRSRMLGEARDRRWEGPPGATSP